MEDRELNQARSKPDTVNRPVRTARIFVHHYNSTHYCNTETVFIYIPLPPDQHHISERDGADGRFVGGRVQKPFLFSCFASLCMQVLASSQISTCTRGDVRLTAPQPACSDLGSKNIAMSYFFPPGNCFSRVCRKPKFGSDSVFKNRTVQKFNIHSAAFPIETACNPPFKQKLTKSNFISIKCAAKENFKT